MLGTTFSLPMSPTPVVLNRINQDNNGSTYLKKETLHQFQMKVRHNTTLYKPTGQIYDRHNLEVVQTIWATATKLQHYRKFYIVMEQLPDDLDVQVPDAVSDALIATANALPLELIGWQV